MKTFTIAIIFTSVDSLNQIERTTNSNDAIFNKIVELLSNSKSAIARRAVEITKRRRDDEMLPLLKGTSKQEEVIARDKQAALVENELQNALAGKKSALLDHPFVEHKGKNDFLVMRPDIFDPFVTIIPNSIYYNVEKKCVNWLDDCSLQGIRARLLRGVLSPYR